MTQTSWQFDPGNYDRATVAQIMNRFRGDGVCYELGNKLAVYQNTPTAMNVLVATGGVQIQGYGMYNNAVVTLPIAAASSTLARIDRIIARLTPTGSPGSIVLAVLTGTAAESPTAPALTQTAGGVWEIELAQVSIPANTTSITTSLITPAASQPLCAWSIPFMAGITMSQALAMTLPGSLTLPAAQIHGVADPSSAQDAATRAYVLAQVSAANSGRLLGITVLTSGSGNFTTSAGTNYLRITVLGPGGNSATGGGSPTSGTGGAGGGMAVKRIAVSPSTAYAYVIGVVETSDTTITIGATTITGRRATTTTPGTATNGDINISGRYGHQGIVVNVSSGGHVYSGHGADSLFGAGGPDVICDYASGTLYHNGTNATGYGAGGTSGVKGQGGSAVTEGSGSPGLLIIEEYS